MPSVACQFELFPQANTCHSILDFGFWIDSTLKCGSSKILDFGLTIFPL